MNAQNNRGTIRSLIIFVVAINVIAWLAYFFAQGAGTPEAQSLGLLVWLVSPLLVSILLRLFTKDWKDIGIKPNLKGNSKWYALSVLIYPVIVAVCFCQPAGSILVPRQRAFLMQF